MDIENNRVQEKHRERSPKYAVEIIRGIRATRKRIENRGV